jgi:hypothetical protein
MDLLPVRLVLFALEMQEGLPAEFDFHRPGIVTGWDKELIPGLT